MVHKYAGVEMVGLGGQDFIKRTNHVDTGGPGGPLMSIHT